MTGFRILPRISLKSQILPLFLFLSENQVNAQHTELPEDPEMGQETEEAVTPLC